MPCEVIPRPTNRWLILVIICLAASFAVLLALRQGEVPKTAHAPAHSTPLNLPSPPATMDPFADRRRVAQQSIINGSPNTAELAKTNANYKFTVDAKRRELLLKLAGMHVTPMIGSPADGQSYTLDEVLAFYPFLSADDGTVNLEAAEKLRSTLNERNRVRWERGEQLRNLRHDTNAFFKLGSTPLPEVHELTEELLAIVNSFETMPTAIKPTEELLAVSPQYGRLSMLQWRGILRMLAEFQTRFENGHSVEQSVAMTQKLFPSYVPRLTHEQALWLLNTPLDRLVTAEYGN